jgi:hypothetical protein
VVLGDKKSFLEIPLMVESVKAQLAVQEWIRIQNLTDV